VGEGGDVMSDVYEMADRQLVRNLTEKSNMSSVVIGIDPGLTGAYAALSDTGDVLLIDDLPVIRDGSSAWIDADKLLSELLTLKPSHITAVIERVHAMPRNGSKGAFSQGCTFASTLATLQIARARIEFVTPVTWKRSLGLIGEKDLSDNERKKRSLDKARLLFPFMDLAKQKHHGRAEALLIAHWYLKTQLREQAA
jgi:crossover junction endodeoxyribonuclease RuvC